MLKTLLRKCWSGWLAVLVLGSLLLVGSTAPVSSTEPLQLIESDDTRVAREGNWMLQATPSASGGSYLYSSGSVGDALTLLFAGPRVAVVYVAHPALGTLALEIDNVVVRTVITTRAETVFGMRAVVDYLQPGTHTLRVFAVAGTIALDAFEAVPAPVLAEMSALSPPAALNVPASPIVYRCTAGLCTMQADGSQRTVIATGGLYAYPTWSPDGNYLLYTLGNVLGLLARDASGDWQPYQGGVWPYTLTELSFLETPAWSPIVGSNQIAFSAIDASGQRGIHCLDFEPDIAHSAPPQFCGSASRLVPNASPMLVDRHPTWSPDESWVAFESNRHNPESADKAIYKYHIGDASPVLVIAPNSDYESYEDPDWSPDLPNGQRIAYAYYPGNPTGGGFSNREDIAGIYTMVPDGSDARPVILQPLERRLDPAWSPDGAHLVYEQRLWDCAEGLCDPEVGWTFTGMGVVATRTGTVIGTDLGWQPDWLPVLCPEGGYPIWLAGDFPGAPEWTNSSGLYIGQIANQSGGLYVYEAPVINAPFLTNTNGEPDYLPWGSGHCVHARKVHETIYETTYNGSPHQVTYREVWYRISEQAENDPVLGQWILAGIQVVGDDGNNKLYIYIEDWDTSADLLIEDPLANVLLNEPTNAIPFRYNRDAATEYLRHTSAENYDNTSALIVDLSDQPGLQPGYRRVVHNDDYLFRGYSYVTGVNGETGSAVYLSQGLWHGGLPMTGPGFPDNPYCVRTPTTNREDHWRYCPEALTGVPPAWPYPISDNSSKWGFHDGVFAHLSHLQDEDTAILATIIAARGARDLVELVIDSETKRVRGFNWLFNYGNQEPVVGRAGWADIYRFFQGDYDELSEYIDDLFGAVETGDYMYVDSKFNSQPAYHGFIVVGWGKPRKCEYVYTNRHDFLEFGTELADEPDLIDPDSYTGDYTTLKFIPYVADFNMGPNLPGTEQRWLQYPGPRPFYCTLVKPSVQGYEDPSKSFRDLFGDVNTFKFYKAPRPDRKIYLRSNEIYAPYFDCYRDGLCND